MELPGALVLVTLANGIEISMAQAYKIKKVSRKELEKNYPQSFKYIRPTLTELEKLKPGLVHRLDTDDSAFNRCLFILPQIIQAIKTGGHTIVALDGCHSRHPTYKGMILVLEGKDGDNRNIPLAFAICPTENTENYM